VKIALAQINTTVGDLAGNEARILDGAARAQSVGADLVLFPELTITGYPPRDLLLKKDFIAGNLAVLERLAAASGPTALLVGYVGENKNNPGRDVTNSAALLQNGKIVTTRTKTLLPTYDVFDEDRYFEPAQDNAPVSIANQICGLTICEDIWNDEDFWPHRRYRSTFLTFRPRLGTSARKSCAPACWPAWRASPAARWPCATLSAAMTNWSSMAEVWCLMGRGS
jgi:NAD+ synthase (glutamine-hydrolysing)